MTECFTFFTATVTKSLLSIAFWHLFFTQVLHTGPFRNFFVPHATTIVPSPFMQERETTQNGCKVRCAQWMRIVFSAIRLELKTSVYEMYVTVMSTVPGCDVTTVQQHYKGSTSTPPRVARLCQIREASLVALGKIHKSTHAHMCRSFDSSNPSYSYPEIPTVTRRHCTTCQVNSSP